MEIWDGYLMDGSLANQDLVRGEPIPKDLYHLVSEILVRHVDGDYLIMQRDFNKPNYGGYYEATAGGSALKGEDKITCAMRELLEETGVTAISYEEIGCYISKDTIYFSFLCITDCNKSSILLQDSIIDLFCPVESVGNLLVTSDRKPRSSWLKQKGNLLADVTG